MNTGFQPSTVSPFGHEFFKHHLFGAVFLLRDVAFKGLRHEGCKTPICLRLFQHTELEHTPSNLYQQAIWRDSFHNWRTGDCLACALGVLQFSWNLVFFSNWSNFFICGSTATSLKECRISGASPFHIRILSVRQAKKNKQVKRLTVRSTSHPGFQSPPGWHDIFRFRNP